MKKHLSKATLGLVMSGLLVGCNTEESKETSLVTTNFALTGSGETIVALSPLQKTFSFFLPSALALTPPALEDSNGVGLNLSEGWIVVKRIQFKHSQATEAGEDAVATSNYRGPFVIDLLSDAPEAFGEIQLPATGLRRVKMLLHKATELPASAPAELAGKSIYLSGSYNGYAFSYAADDTTDYMISGPNAIVPEAGKDLLAVIRLADLFKKIDLSSIGADTHITASNRVAALNPCPEIHATASDLYSCFRMGMASEAKFGKDNGDKDLTSSDETVE